MAVAGSTAEAALETDGDGEFRLRPNDTKAWTCEDVGDWLAEKGFEQYRNVFVENHVNGAVLVKMDRGSLAELIPSLGHRLSLLDEIERLTGPRTPRHVGEGVVGGISGFASKFMHGLNHLVSDPIEGVSKDGVQGLVKGIGTGLAGAIQYPVEGVAVFSKQLGDGFRFTPDTIFGVNVAQELPVHRPKYLTPDDELRSKPNHIGEGIMIGFKRLSNGVYDGVTGLVTEPMRASAVTSRESPSVHGFAVVRGVAKGLTGAVCKPMAGTFDFASSTVEGLMATPDAIIAAAKEGPSIQETPTFRRLANLRLPSPEAIRVRLGMRAQPAPEVVAQFDEIRQNSRKDGHNSD